MTIIIAIVILLWSASALARRADNKRTAKQINNVSKRTAKVEKNVINLEVNFEKLAKEQEKQAAQLAKHEKRIADLEFRMEQAEGDIEFLNERIANLDAQRDYLLLQQSATVAGGKEHTKYQSKIISIENQIHTAENKLNKAKHIKAMAEREIEVA